MRKIILVVHNVRSAHNVGSLLRTSDGLGIERVILSGYTPYPVIDNDVRLPHLAERTQRRIHKTALGAEDSVSWIHTDNPANEITNLKKAGYTVASLEQTDSAIDLSLLKPPARLALFVGNEISGLETSVLNDSDLHLYIPMRGAKESFNVAAATAMALYYLGDKGLDKPST